MRGRNWLAGFVLFVTSCHSATVRVERTSSGAIERDHDFDPRRGPDGHYVSFPAFPFVNCVDAVEADLLTSGSGSRLHTFSGKPATEEKQVLGKNACEGPESYRNFIGYRKSDLLPHAKVSWLPATDEEEQLALDRLVSDLQAGPAGLTPQPMGSFIHLSDVQIREHDATLGNPSVSARLDKIVQSFQRDADQELYSMFVYAAFVDTINAELGVVDTHRPKPTVMIHTGDAVDAGLRSEFEQFQTLSDRLGVPWFQVIGNHDALAFGNLRLIRPELNTEGDENCHGSGWKGHACTCTRTADLIREFNLRRPDNLGETHGDTPSKLFTLVPALLKRICIVHEVHGDAFVMNPEHFANTINAFIGAHCRLPIVSDAFGWKCSAPPNADAYPVAASAPYRCATLDGQTPRSVLNGFDLDFDAQNLPTDTAHGREIEIKGQFSASGTPSLLSEQTSNYGHYCFQLTQGDGTKAQPRIWMVALNTTTPNGAYGHVDAGQRRWLKHVLEDGQIGEHDLVLVFGHHPLYGIFDPTARKDLTELLTSHRNVIGYFAGHTHTSELRLIHPLEESKANHHVWEVVAPAIISYPQQGRQVTIKRVGDNLGYIEILSFTPAGWGDSQEKLERANRGALRDKCQESPKRCENDHPHLPGREVTFPRLFFRMP